MCCVFSLCGNGPRQHQQEAKHRNYRFSNGPNLTTDADSARKALQKSGLCLNLLITSIRVHEQLWAGVAPTRQGHQSGHGRAKSDSTCRNIPSTSEQLRTLSKISEHDKTFSNNSEHLRQVPSKSEQVRIIPSNAEHIRTFPNIAQAIPKISHARDCSDLFGFVRQRSALIGVVRNCLGMLGIVRKCSAVF
jgi:hypothetical protein